jgi:hypothetical protein
VSSQTLYYKGSELIQVIVKGDRQYMRKVKEFIVSELRVVVALCKKRQTQRIDKLYARLLDEPN